MTPDINKGSWVECDPLSEAYRQHLIESEGLNVTGHPDGACIRYGGGVVDVFPTVAAAWIGKLIAQEALIELDECLRRTA